MGELSQLGSVSYLICFSGIVDIWKIQKNCSQLRDTIIKNYEENAESLPINGQLCNEDLELLRDWVWDTNKTAQYQEVLTTEVWNRFHIRIACNKHFVLKQGWNELKQLAKDYQRAFPELLENVYSAEKFLFRHTVEQRAQASFGGFADGLFGDAFSTIELDPIPEPDMLLKVCSW